MVKASNSQSEGHEFDTHRGKKKFVPVIINVVQEYVIGHKKLSGAIRFEIRGLINRDFIYPLNPDIRRVSYVGSMENHRVAIDSYGLQSLYAMVNSLFSLYLKGENC